MKKLFSFKMSFFFLSIVFIWFKTYMAYTFEFNLGVEGTMQEFLLVINPLSSAIVFLGLTLWMKGRKAAIWMLIVNVVMTVVLIADVLYYRFFDDFLTIATLSQSSNIGEMQEGVLGILSWHDLLYFVDLIVLTLIVVKRPELKNFQLRKWVSPLVVIAGTALFFINLGLANEDRPELLQRTFDRNYIVKYLGLYNYTIYDGIQTAQIEAQKAYASSDDLTKISNYTTSHYAKPNEKYFGIAEGKNIIKIHLESFQTFLIDYKLNGEEVTPFLNKLAHGQDNMIYFDNFFHHTGQGKTSDAELTTDNSLYGLPEGAAFMTKGLNTYQSLAEILDQNKEYTSAVFHADEKTFWNRNQIYKRIGYDYFFHDKFYNVTEENSENLGLKDKEFLSQSIPLLTELEQPFYAHLMTMTHHYPFTLDEEDATIAKGTTGDETVDNYFQTARYLDEAVEQLFNDLKANGLYDDTVVIIYGDHNGISTNHNRAMEEVLGKEITPFQNAQNQRVPLLMHIPGVEGGVNHTYGGQIDLMPTILHLQGIDNRKLINFGTDLFSEEHDETVAFRDGGFVTPKYTYVNDIVYDTQTGEVIEDDDTEEIQKLKRNVIQQLQLSDEVLYKDLLRFHELENFEKVDPANYDYTVEAFEEKYGIIQQK
ncbi:LTA synthase family protein [Radiobacillus kanasensis]|uniref:LTA synthase family protein n=1 Tax=Radiobacillus kanasensis TaxID=2844358 RepID=UPI001E317359|nr:LTA synthase family protein [Radiobacillus kanasensis]UFT99751.1 LTA synthase family protein [Radiobacillus kanasensis]